jgi:hypothetical protein
MTRTLGRRRPCGATAWHWLDPAIRYRRAHRLLRPSGQLAFWSARHGFPAGFDSFFTAIQEVYVAIGEGFGEEWPPRRHWDAILQGRPV